MASTRPSIGASFTEGQIKISHETDLHSVVLLSLGVRASRLEVEVSHELPGRGSPAMAPVGPPVVALDQGDARVVGGAAREPRPVRLALTGDELWNF